MMPPPKSGTPSGRAAALVALGLLAAAGLAPRAAGESREQARPAPSSTLTRAEAAAQFAGWAGRPDRTILAVAATGSMVPTLDSRSLLLLERATAADLRPGDIALYTTAPDGSGEALIVHRVAAVHAAGVLFAGDNNRHSDGWIAPQRVRWRVAAIVYTTR